MNIKIDTKEKFNVINIHETALTANMAEMLDHLLLPYLEKSIPHVILKLTAVSLIDDVIAEKVVSLQQKFYNNYCSFVTCEVNKTILNKLKELDLLDLLNFAPTESEAWDIVQMEEIERELLS
jgi:hypothetical protein